MVFNQRPSRAIQTVEEWDHAFTKFYAILIRRRPEASEALIAHQQHVKKIASSHGDWKGYDEAYRWGVADGSISWGQMNAGLTMDAVLFSQAKQAFVPAKTQSFQPKGPGQRASKDV